MKTLNTSPYDFLHAAESDFVSVQILSANCSENSIGFLAAQACEKYLKHLIVVEKGLTDLNSIPVPKEDLHNLSRLCAYLFKSCNFEISYDLRDNFYKVGRLYSQVRYPGHFLYHDITKSEIELCVNTVIRCRNVVLNRLEELKHKEEEKEIE